MGNTRSNRKYLEIRRLEEITGVPRHQFSNIHDEHKRKNQGEEESKVVLIDRVDCRHFINQVGVGADNQRQVDCVFRIFLDDEDKMSSEELFSAIVMLSDTMDGVNRLQYVIDTHNPRGEDENVVTRKYGRRILKYMNEFFDIKKVAKPAAVWIQLCGGTDLTEVTRDDFIQYVSSTAPYKDFLI